MNDLTRTDQPDTSTLILVHESEINQQIATARRFPRQMGRIMSEIDAYATQDEDTAMECVYALKRDGKEIIGPTARFAEIVATSWGNARYAARIIDESETFITAEAVFHDLEKNTYISVQVPRRIVNREGKRFGVDMIGVTSSAAMSIAMRNAILKGVPKAAWGPGYSKCLAMIKGTFESIEKRRTAALDAYKKLGIDQQLVLDMLGKSSVRDIEPEDMVILRGTLQAVRDGDTTLSAVFGVGAQRAKGQQKARIEDQLDRGRENEKAAQEAKTKQGASQGQGEGGGTKSHTEQAGDDDFPGDRAGPGSEPDAKPAGGVDDSRGGDDAGGDMGGSVSDAEDPDRASEPELTLEAVPANFGAFIDEEFKSGDRSKLENLARALAGAATTADVSAVTAEFHPIFESASTAVEQAAQKMIAEAQKIARANKRGRSAASKL